MQCAFCKESIDDDSFYCDMCGEEIKTCPSCKKPGKSKMCTSCGKVLVSVRPQTGQLATSGNSTDASTPPLTSSALKPELAATDGGTIRLADTEAVPQLRLINKNINVNLKIENNMVLGRESEPYAAIFDQYQDVSRKHCRFHYEKGKGWYVTDLGSMNKTKYCNQELVPSVPQPLKDQSLLKIAKYEFLVSICK